MPWRSTALEINGRGRGEIFAKRKALRKAQQYAVDVLALIQKGAAREGEPYLAIEDVAKFHDVHRNTVERGWRQLKGRGALLYPGGWEWPPTPSRGLPGRAPRVAETPASKRPD
jgi:DNA-binding transcriptional MocR family regulator